MSTYGHISGIPIGATFSNRAALREAGLHAPLYAGISPNVEFGALSIVLNGGYEDDEDWGDVIVYTGQGSIPQLSRGID
ncbi:Carboxymuconolactone decarboxylase [Mycena indigotica]|uniref:Carboxymuconolactone decarboxylase n=1 Tax=Mycena indigotica TaxID=2126181 RepID=A0A8H6T961_9AGAR|nr:Carboxymuconolactone decarboxylase [Mycena indigotica]KAF7312637.1 Carboxymuconolactone decarboxylase [Mycena indigotica]